MVKLAEQANSSYSLIVKRESFLGPNFMSEIRFIAKGGQSVDGRLFVRGSSKSPSLPVSSLTMRALCGTMRCTAMLLLAS